MVSTKLVLVVDDDEHDREIYGKLLWYNNFDVICAVNAEQGYWLAREAQPDLVLLDLGLPDRDGVALCRELKREAETADVPVVVLSGRPQVDYETRTWGVGCSSYIEKPALPSRVVSEVERLIGPSTPPDVGRAASATWGGRRHERSRPHAGEAEDGHGRERRESEADAR